MTRWRTPSVAETFLGGRERRETDSVNDKQHTQSRGDVDANHGVRLDRWLWAARFFKTRALAAEAIAGGKVHLNGQRAKRSKLVHADDELRIRKGPYEHHVIVRRVAERRGPAKEAQELYTETPASARARKDLAAQLKAVVPPTFRGKGRPTKKERRDIERFKRERGY